MTTTKHSRKHATHGTCIVSQRTPERHGGIVNTAWAVLSLWTLSQHGTGVCAFTHLQKTSKIQSVHTKRVKSDFQPRLSSCLNYRNIESQPSLKDRFQQYHIETFQLPNITNDKWKTSAHGRMDDDKNLSPEIDQQSIIDEYLESIDRRYKRVHQNETKNDRSHKGFISAWAWLTSVKPSLKKEAKQRNEENALCVLGLAELASARLLQKHHLSVTQSQQLSSKGEDSRTIGIRKEKDSTTTLSIRTILAAKALTRLLTSIQKAYIYRCVAMSRQLKAGLYHSLRHSGSTFTQFLAALNLTSRYMIGGRFASQFAFMVACAIVVTHI